VHRATLFFSFFLLWCGTHTLCMPALRPSSEAGPMRNPRDGASVVYYYYYYYNVTIIVLPSYSSGGTLQNLYLKLLHRSMQTFADHQSGQCQVSRMTDEKNETRSPFRTSKLSSRPESLVADCSMPTLQPLERRGRQG